MTAAQGVVLRDLSGMAEFRQAEDLQRAVWGEGDPPDPADLMMVIQSEGGLVAGAFQEGRLLGHVFAFPTATPGVQHSHRLAVLETARGLGLGLRLKLYQRDWCRARGIGQVRWTFDPLRAPNAALNIHRLGATARTYHDDYYGAMEGINRGLPSDRIVADWWLDDPRLAALDQGTAPPPPAAAQPLEIALPEDLTRLAADDPARALDLRLSLRAALRAAFAEGRRIVGYLPARRVYLLDGPT